MPESEREFQTAVIELARRLDWKVAHFHDSRREVRPGVFVGDKDAIGFPDLILARERIIFAELKREKGRLTAAQIDWLDALSFACVGTTATVREWRPSQWSEIEATLKAYDG